MAVQGVLPQQNHQYTEQPLFADPILKTVAFVGGVIFASLASFYILPAQDAWMVTISSAVVATVTWSILSSTPEANAKRLFKSARESHDGQDFNAAIQDYQEALALEFGSKLFRARILSCKIWEIFYSSE